MASSRAIINVNMDTKIKEETKNKVKKIEEMIQNPKKYPRYNNREDLKKALLSDDLIEKREI